MRDAIDACLNCGTPLDGPYCVVCGQAAKEPRRVVIGLVQDVIFDTLAIDGKLMRTIALLFLWPGRLARRYIDGQRVRHTTPFRMYLFTSLVFFITLFWVLYQNEVLPNGPAGADPPTSALVIEETPSPDAANAPDIDDGDGDFEESDFEDAPDWIRPHLQRLAEAENRVSEDPRYFISQLQANIPRAMLLAPAVYTLILALLYIYRRKFLVYDHLIVSLYMHAALYFYLIMALLLGLIPAAGGWLAAIPLLWGALQPFAVLRQAYRSNWFSVVVKGFISNLIYAVALSFIIAFGFVVALYQS
ncbi:MAG: DUF3667 domain-containing protein [Pseudomonadota bacterium]